MELAFDMGPGAWILVLGAGAAFGLVAQLIDNGMSLMGWFVDTIAFAAGAAFASEVIVAFRTTGPVWDNLALVPALAGGLVVGVLVEALIRMIAGGITRSSHGPMSA